MPILERGPKEWPVAPVGTWEGWEVTMPPPDAAAADLQRVLTAYRRGDLRAALEALYALLDSAPDYPTALRQAGVIYFRLRRYTDAITAFERYLTLAPQRVGDTRMLAHSYYSLGLYQEAEQHYIKVLAEQPNSPEAHRGLGLASMRLGDIPRALAELRLVLSLDSSHANAATWIAQILFNQGDVGQALKAATVARDLDPFEARPWFLLGQAHYELGDEVQGDAAIARFDVLSAHAQRISAAQGRLLYDPDQPALYRQVIALHHQIGNLRGIQSTWASWGKVDRGSIEVHVGLLGVTMELGDLKNAKVAAERLRSLAGGNLAAWRSLERFYRASGDQPGVAESSRQVQRLSAGGRAGSGSDADGK